MTCREFEEVLNEFADDRLPDAAVRKRALVHSSICEACAARLAAARALAAHLSEFAGATRREHASPRVRANLLVAVAERAPAQPQLAQVISIASRKSAAWPRWALAAAATILAFVTIAGWFWSRSASPIYPAWVNPARPNPARPNPARPNPARDAAADQSKPSRIETPPPPILAPRPERKLAPQFIKAGGARRNPAIQSSAQELDVASEFVPLTLAADERAIANGTLVRLEMNRDKLIAMGLPLSVETGRRTVNAEVVMGDNGVAYAIRVVR